MELTVTGVDDEALTSDDEIVGVTEFDASAASSVSDVGITCRNRSVGHIAFTFTKDNNNNKNNNCHYYDHYYETTTTSTPTTTTPTTTTTTTRLSFRRRHHMQEFIYLTHRIHIHLHKIMT